MPEYITDVEREADELCQNGIDLCEQQKQLSQAHLLFAKAYEMAGHNPKIQSWYGYTLALVEKKSQKGFLLCRQAVDSNVPDAYLFRNIGVLFIQMNNRNAAIGAFAKGLQIDKDHRAIWNEWLKLGVRRKPVLGFLPREHAINKFLGQLTWKYLKSELKQKRKK